MQDLTNFISNVGFPIVCCFFMFRQNNLLSKSILDLSITLNNIDKRLEYLEKEVNKDVKNK